MERAVAIGRFSSRQHLASPDCKATPAAIRVNRVCHANTLTEVNPDAQEAINAHGTGRIMIIELAASNRIDRGNRRKNARSRLNTSIPSNTIAMTIMLAFYHTLSS
ncbi:MAG: hypothetical protein BWY66_02562 [bacterium ADurb.Bin374]|nr:MAG: hypothetical protein BWY66_02562 [bacterium ADurb.Bin374]